MGLKKEHCDITIGLNGGPVDYAHLHVDEPHRHKEHVKGIVVTTLRNPTDVFISHAKRYCNFDDEHNMKRVMTAFDDWDEMVKEFDPFIFKVDEENREQEARRLANWLFVDDFNYVDVDPKSHKETALNRTKLPFNGQVPKEILELSKQYGY